jgi:ATP-dependent RNA helicase DDX42
LKAGVDILIASPGRLIEMIKKKATNLLRVTYLVIDEADKMFSLGFEQQLRSIIGQIRDDRQTLLFTATLRRTVQSLVADFLVSPVTINIGEENQAN